MSSLSFSWSGCKSCISRQSDDGDKIPWKDGFYASKEDPTEILMLKQDSFRIFRIFFLDQPDEERPGFAGEIVAGRFGKADKETCKALEMKKVKYNIKLLFQSNDESAFGVWTKDHNLAIYYQTEKDLSQYKWMDEESLRNKLNAFPSLIDLPCPYKIQPEIKGKLVWIEGPPGSGKSTVAQLMAQESGFALYEGDSIMELRNPFMDPNKNNPSIAAFEQEFIKDIPLDIVKTKYEEEEHLDELFKQNKMKEYDWKYLSKMMAFMAENIKFQHSRIGGDFVVAYSIPTLIQRAKMQEILPNCIFIYLNISRELQEARLIERHCDDPKNAGFCLGWSDNLHETPKEGTTIFINVTKDMTPSDLKAEIMKVLQK